MDGAPKMVLWVGHPPTRHPKFWGEGRGGKTTGGPPAARWEGVSRGLKPLVSRWPVGARTEVRAYLRSKSDDLTECTPWGATRRTRLVCYAFRHVRVDCSARLTCHAKCFFEPPSGERGGVFAAH